MVDNHSISGNGKGRNLTIWINDGCIQIRDKYHITFFYHSVAVVGSIETNTVCHSSFCELRRRNRYMAELTVNIYNFEVHHFDSIVLYEFHNILCCFLHKNILHIRNLVLKIIQYMEEFENYNFFIALPSINLIRFSWFTSLAPGS